MKEIIVWDWPIRLFHWLVVLMFTGLILSGKAEDDYLQWHFYMGYALSTLLIARVLYGFIGSKYARFSHFITGPRKIVSYADSVIKGNKKEYLGHNPLGAMMVMALIFLLCIQWLTGLVNSDDIFWYGPLYEWVSEDTQTILSKWHHRLPDILLGLVTLHIIAVLFHEIALKERLVRAMITGKKRLHSNYQQTIENEEVAKTPRLGVVLSLSVSLLWFIWLYSLPI